MSKITKALQDAWDSYDADDPFFLPPITFNDREAAHIVSAITAALADARGIESAKPFIELRPRDNGAFDEMVCTFGDGMVFIETMDDKSVYLGFYHDDGRAQQLWIRSGKKLSYHTENADGPPPRFTAQGVDRRPLPPAPAAQDGGV